MVLRLNATLLVPISSLGGKLGLLRRLLMLPTSPWAHKIVMRLMNFSQSGLSREPVQEGPAFGGRRLVVGSVRNLQSSNQHR
jgi:hypothetical protein